MFIQTEDTPNPDALKFLPGMAISPNGPVFFHSPEDAEGDSTLACILFAIDDVKAVFYGADFITITKESAATWDVLKPEILMTLMDHFLSGMPIFDKLDKTLEQRSGRAGNAPAQKPLDQLTEQEKEIIEIIETRVRPSVAMDGGDIIFHSFEDGIVYLELHGACSGCPSSSVTLKNGIESMLKHFVPDVQEVVAINS